MAGLGAVSWGPNRLDVFARASNGDVWQRWFDGTWRAWAPLGFNAGSAVAATSWAVGRLDLFYRDPSTNRLHHRYYQNGWFDGGLVGASAIPEGPLTAAAWAIGRIDVFHRGASSELRDFVTATAQGIADAEQRVTHAYVSKATFSREGLRGNRIAEPTKRVGIG